MKRLFFWATIAAGVTAAVLMARRGESLGNIAKKALDNPFGALGNELQNAITSGKQSPTLQS